MNRKAILITGGNGALGQAIARSFLSERAGAHVYLGVRERRAEAERIAAEFQGFCTCLDLDVTKPDAWQAAVKRVVSEQEGIHVLVNNAGKHSDALLATMDPSSWHEVIRTNLDSAFFGCQAVVSQMMAQRSGRIINIASLSAIMAPLGQTNYAAAKAGLVALTSSLAKEVARASITVNAICPGFIETEALRSMGAEERATAVRRVPMRRFGRPEEVAAAVKFLASSEASYITGSVLKIDGGIF